MTGACRQGSASNGADTIYSMIKTGDWSIADLTKYLVAVQSTLSKDELQRLRITAAFPREHKEIGPDGEKVKVPRSKASDLYEPLDVFREMGLPVIDWHAKSWKGSSEEGSTFILLTVIDVLNASMQPNSCSTLVFDVFHHWRRFFPLLAALTHVFVLSR